MVAVFALAACGDDDSPSSDAGVDAPPAAAGITVDPVSGLVTTESGGTATFTIVLDRQPTADVSIALSSSIAAEGTVDPASVTFTAANWNAPQTVTVTGVDDGAIDGDQTYVIVTAPAASSDAAYNGLDAADPSVSNTDNDTAGVTVTPTAGLATDENGLQATFTVVLNTQPTADVTIGLTSSAPTEGTVAPAEVTFTTANWNAPQTVTVTGVDDAQQDGPATYTIVTAAAASADTRYQGIDPDDVTVVNTDNDTAGVTVTPTTISTNESGQTATFTIVLNTQPSADVSIALSSSNTAEGTVAPAAVTFTTANWNAPQTVTVTGVNDPMPVEDGDQPYTIVTGAAQSTDALYSGFDVADVAATNVDDDTAGFAVTPATITTTESGGTAAFTVRLTTQPSANVTVGVSSSNMAEGTVSASALTFTMANWNAPQTVTVTGVEDSPPMADGDQPYTIVLAAATSTDPTYSGKNPPDVAATNADNDSAGIRVTPTSGLVTTESGGTATFTIVLATQPSANVAIGLSSSRPGEGTPSAASVTFTSANWNVAQTVTVTGVNDNPAVVDGNQPYTIVTAAATSTDARYAGLNAADVGVTNIDNDGTAGITVTPSAGLTTREDAPSETATFTVVLDAQPTSSVTIGIASSDTTEGTVTPSSLTFTIANWQTPQTVTVAGVDDAATDGNQSYTIVTAPATSTDARYSGLNAVDASVTNIDNETAGVTVTPQSGLVTTEAGGTATFTVRLNRQPTANVSIDVSSNDTTEGTASPATLTFTIANWATPQTVTVTGANDATIDGDQVYVITTANAVSTDVAYTNMTVPDVSVTNLDDDNVAGFTITPTTGLVTTEAGGTATFTVRLSAPPTANVTLGLSSSDATEGTVAPASLTFTTANWNANQTVTVTGVNDAIDDGNVAYSIVTAAATSTDARYSGLNPSDVGVTNNDDADAAGFTLAISPAPCGRSTTTALETDETGTSDCFTLRLNSQPTGTVVIGLSTASDEVAIAPSSLSFTTANWNVAQQVVVSGLDDSLDDGNVAFTIVTAVDTAQTADATYDALNPPDVTGTNADNDANGFTVSPNTGLFTTEAGGTTTFTVRLNAQPTGTVTVPLSSSDTTEGTVSPSSLTFTTANWNAAQTVTVTGVDDLVDDDDIDFDVVGPASGGGYAGLTLVQTVTNRDDDTAGVDIVMSPAPCGRGTTTRLETTEAGLSDCFGIRLTSQPKSNVTFSLSSSNVAEGTVGPSSVTFTPANWNAFQIVTATGVDDLLPDGPQDYTIVIGAAVTSGDDYTGLNPADVSATNDDNEP